MRGSRAPAATQADAAALAPLYERLANRGFSVEVIRPGKLPSVATEVSPKQHAKRNLPTTARPRIGLSTSLRGDALAFVYRFDSTKLAQAAAPSFLRTWGSSVEGCGPTVFFARPADRNAGAWTAEVRSFLREDRRCKGKQFLVVG